MVKSERIKKMLRKRFLRRLRFFMKCCIYIGIIIGLIIFYKNDSINFSNVKENILTSLILLINNLRDEKHFSLVENKSKHGMCYWNC